MVGRYRTRNEGRLDSKNHEVLEKEKISLEKKEKNGKK